MADLEFNFYFQIVSDGKGKILHIDGSPYYHVDDEVLDEFCEILKEIKTIVEQTKE